MDYEKAWKRLKVYTSYFYSISINTKEFESMDFYGFFKAKAEHGAIKMILDRMDKLEKEMTTVRDDDGQSAQD